MNRIEPIDKDAFFDLPELELLNYINCIVSIFIVGLSIHRLQTSVAVNYQCCHLAPNSVLIMIINAHSWSYFHVSKTTPKYLQYPLMSTFILQSSSSWSDFKAQNIIRCDPKAFMVFIKFLFQYFHFFILKLIN
jgi:hypothetical protein